MDNFEQNQDRPTSNFPEDKQPKSSWGQAVGLIIILVIIIIGGLYFFKGSNQLSTPVTSPDDSVADIENELLKLQNQDQSDELEGIEQDLEETDLENLDAELDDVEQELMQIES